MSPKLQILTLFRAAISLNTFTLRAPVRAWASRGPSARPRPRAPRRARGSRDSTLAASIVAGLVARWGLAGHAATPRRPARRRRCVGASHELQLEGVRNANGNARAANTNVFGKHTMWPPGSHPPLTPREVSRSPPGRRAFRRPLRTRCADFLVSTCAYVHLRPGLQR